LNTYLLLSNIQLWGTLLAACVWMIWLERNKRVFNASSHSGTTNVFYLILHLFRVWTGSSNFIENMLAGAPGAASLNSTQLSTALPQSVGSPPTHLSEDGDLLDD
jgi:hypothetical protein